MGLMSTLALLSLPLLKRPELASKNLPEFLDPRVIENAALKTRIAALEAKVNELRCALDDARRDMTLARRERDYWHGIVAGYRAQGLDYGALSGFQQAEQSQSNQALAQQAQAQALQPPGPFHQLQAWHDCTCVPGRAAAFGILREGDAT